MPPSLDELRHYLVVHWRVISERTWNASVNRGVVWMLDKLSRTVRFRRAAGNIPFLTTFLREAFENGQADAMVVVLNGQPWLKLEE